METRYKVSSENDQIIKKYLDFKLSTGRSERTIRNYKFALMKHADFLGDKQFKDATSEDIQQFFQVNKFKWNVRDLYGAYLKGFYRYVFGLGKGEVADNIKFFENSTSTERRRSTDPDKKKLLITRDEYNAIIQSCQDITGMDQAMFETYYLSGGRLSEVLNMKIKDVKENEGHVTITLIDSKTQPRNVALPEQAKNLMRWLGNHPEKDDPDHVLWISHSRSNFGKPIACPESVHHKFLNVLKRAGIDRKLTTHSFRKTRATIYFNDVNEEGYHRWDNKEIANIFGWSISGVDARRQEYDLRTEEDLHNKIFKTQTKQVETYDDIKEENERIKNDYEQRLNVMEQKMQKMVEMAKSDWYKDKQKSHVIFEATNPETGEHHIEESIPETDTYTDEQLLQRYNKNQVEMCAIKKLGLETWANLKRLKILEKAKEIN